MEDACRGVPNKPRRIKEQLIAVMNPVLLAHRMSVPKTLGPRLFAEDIIPVIDDDDPMDQHKTWVSKGRVAPQHMGGARL